jgi:hypothetical protein
MPARPEGRSALAHSSKAPSRLAELLTLAEAEHRRGRDPIEEHLTRADRGAVGGCSERRKRGYTCEVDLARRGTLALVVCAVIALGACGGRRMATTGDKHATLTAPSAKTPLSVPASARLCPPNDAEPQRLLLGKTATNVLVPGRPSGALICRYWGISGRTLEPEDERARIPRGEHGHPVHTIAEARRVVRQDVTSYLVGEFDALRPIGPHPNCDEVLGGRSEMIAFYYEEAAKHESFSTSKAASRCATAGPPDTVLEWGMATAKGIGQTKHCSDSPISRWRGIPGPSGMQSRIIRIRTSRAPGPVDL